METIVNRKEEAAVIEISEFLKTLTEEELREFNSFIQGIKFMKQVTEKKSA